MPDRLQARTFNEVRYYLLVTPCPQCGKGPWEIDSDDAGGGQHLVVAHCRNCRHAERFRVDCEHPDAGGEPINPSDEPSRLIDLSQWMSLFYLLLEQASRATPKAQARLLGYRAALCLAEALKFFPLGELTPPESAFFSPAGRTAFREHPENFARPRLLDMQSRLPALPKMAGSVRRDRAADRPRRPWWKFWKRPRPTPPQEPDDA
ncbi:MAG TPA: hypothetical protein PK082_06890 [Phycisphaerae bacterium]|nr:hypothetical protein [Phycisphaerae bacterium]